MTGGAGDPRPVGAPPGRGYNAIVIESVNRHLAPLALALTSADSAERGALRGPSMTTPGPATEASLWSIRRGILGGIRGRRPQRRRLLYLCLPRLWPDPSGATEALSSFCPV